MPKIRGFVLLALVLVTPVSSYAAKAPNCDRVYDGKTNKAPKCDRVYDGKTNKAPGAGMVYNGDPVAASQPTTPPAAGPGHGGGADTAPGGKPVAVGDEKGKNHGGNGGGSHAGSAGGAGAGGGGSPGSTPTPEKPKEQKPPVSKAEFKAAIVQVYGILGKEKDDSSLKHSGRAEQAARILQTLVNKLKDSVHPLAFGMRRKATSWIQILRSDDPAGVRIPIREEVEKGDD